MARLDQQLYAKGTLMEAYDQACEEEGVGFPAHLLVDLAPRTPRRMQFRTCICSPHQIVYLPNL